MTFVYLIKTTDDIIVIANKCGLKDIYIISLKKKERIYVRIDQNQNYIYHNMKTEQNIYKNHILSKGGSRHKN